MSDEIKNADDGEELVEEKADKAAKVKKDKTDKTDKSKPVKQKKPPKGPIFKRMWTAIVRFVKNFKGEIKKIVWPKRQMVLKSTGIVLATIIIIGAGVWIVDYAISGGLKVINKQADKYKENATAVSTTLSADDTTGKGTTSSSDKTTNNAKTSTTDAKASSSTTAKSSATTAKTETTTAKAESTTASTTESTTAD